MASKTEFTAIIANIQKLKGKLELAPTVIAKQCLDATYHQVPRPPWNTGQLRSSGAAYVGGRRVAKTPLTGPNPKGSWTIRKRTKHKAVGGLSRGSATGTVKAPETTNITKFSQPGLEVSGNLPSTVTGSISIVYHSPVAALMHEWDGNFSDAQSGKYYISSKIPQFFGAFVTVMKRIW